MILTIEFWQLISMLVSLLVALAGVFAAIAKALLGHVQKTLDQRFGSLEKSADAWQELEREFLNFKLDVAVTYVRREDYVRGQSVIEAKLDAIASELKRVQIDGVKQGNGR